MDKVALLKKEVQAEEWAAKIRACRGSGMSITAWCRENGIAPKTYYYHLRKLREKLCEQIPVSIASVPESTESVMTVSTAEIRVDIRASAPAEGIEAVIRALKCREAVPEERAAAYRTPIFSAVIRSTSSIFFPTVDILLMCCKGQPRMQKNKAGLTAFYGKSSFSYYILHSCCKRATLLLTLPCCIVAMHS